MHLSTFITLSFIVIMRAFANPIDDVVEMRAAEANIMGDCSTVQYPARVTGVCILLTFKLYYLAHSSAIFVD